MRSVSVKRGGASSPTSPAGAGLTDLTGQIAIDSGRQIGFSFVSLSVTETPFFFPRGDVRLFGFLHAPGQRRGRTAFVMSHPFGEEKLWSHRVLVSFARALAQRGCPVLRFDYMGAGDSSGQTSDTSLQSHLDDLHAAVEALVAREPTIERIGLVGLRLGASLAARLAAAGSVRDRLADAPLVLWDPVVDGLAYFQEILRSNLTTQLAVYGNVQESREVLQAKVLAGGTVNVDGYEIGKPLFESCAVPQLLPPGACAQTGPVLIVQIVAGDHVKDRADLRDLAANYPRGTFQRCIEQPFWREIKPFYGRAENLQSATLGWLEQCDV
jgi:exosortase A-associated hydrolase 2